jgi:hypothetical protein
VRRPHLGRYIAPFVHFLVATSHVMWAFSQEACVFGVFVAADADTVNATAIPTAIMIETRFFMVFPSLRFKSQGHNSREPLPFRG